MIVPSAVRRVAALAARISGSALLIHIRKVLGLRLIERAVRASVVALEERIVNVLDRDIEPVQLTVYRKRNVARERRRGAGLPHDQIGNIVLHAGRVGIKIVEVQLVEALIGLALFVFAEIELEAVAVRIGRSDGRKGGVALRGEGNVFDSAAVDRDVDLVFRFRERVRGEVVPILFGDLDVDAVDIARVEKAGFVFLRFGIRLLRERFAPKLRIGKIAFLFAGRGRKNGKNKRESEQDADDPVAFFQRRSPPKEFSAPN